MTIGKKVNEESWAKGKRQKEQDPIGSSFKNKRFAVKSKGFLGVLGKGNLVF